MLRRRISALLCVCLVLMTLMPATAFAAKTGSLTQDFNGDGVQDELNYVVNDAVLTLQIGGASLDVELNELTDLYYLGALDLDSADSFIEIVVGNEGCYGRYPMSTLWQILRYDGEKIYPLAVDCTAVRQLQAEEELPVVLRQYGFGGSSVRAFKCRESGELTVPSKGIVWLEPWLGKCEYSEYEERYVLEGDTLVLQPSDELYPVSASSSEGETAYVTTRQLVLHEQQSTDGGIVLIAADTAVELLEASPSGWLKLRSANGLEGYVRVEQGWQGQRLDAAGRDLYGAVEAVDASYEQQSNSIAPTEEPTEAPTEAPTEEPTEAPTEAPTEEPTEAPTEAPTEEPTETTTEVPTEAPTEEPTEAPTEAPTEEPTEAPTEMPTEEPTETPTEVPTEAPTEEPTEAPTEMPTEEPTEAPTEEPTETPTEEPTETPTEVPTEAPTEEPTEAPTEVPTETPTEAPAHALDEQLESESMESMAVDSALSTEEHSAERATGIDFNGDGIRDKLNYVVNDTVLKLQIRSASIDVELNDFTSIYYLGTQDLDSTDSFVEIFVGNEGCDGEYPLSTLWQILRYDGEKIYPLSVDCTAICPLQPGEELPVVLSQYGFGGNSMRTLKYGENGELIVPSKGVIWLEPWMCAYEYSEHEEQYVLEGDTLVMQLSDELYPVSALYSEGDTIHVTTRQLALYEQQSTDSDAIVMAAGTVVELLEASPSGWLKLQSADGLEGYLLIEQGWSGQKLDAAGDELLGAIEAVDASYEQQNNSIVPTEEPTQAPTEVPTEAPTEAPTRALDELEGDSMAPMAVDGVLLTEENSGESVTGIDFNGDGRQDELNYVVNGIELKLQIKSASIDVKLNEATDMYYLGVQDLDSTDSFVEIFVGNEGFSCEYPTSTLWQILRYDGKKIYPLTVDYTAVCSLKPYEEMPVVLEQYGFGSIYMRALKYVGNGELIVPSKGVIWLIPWMGEYEYSEYEERYVLEGDTLVLQPSDKLYPVSELYSEGERIHVTTRQIVLYEQQSTDSDRMRISAGTAVELLEASPSGWLKLQSADGLEGYLLIEQGWGGQSLDAVGHELLGAVEAIDSGAQQDGLIVPGATLPPDEIPMPDDERLPEGEPAEEDKSDAPSWTDDFDGDGVEETFYLDGAFVQPIGSIAYTELWYSGASGEYMLYHVSEYFEPDCVVILDVGDCKLFTIDQMTSGSEVFAGVMVYKVESGEPVKVEIESGHENVCGPMEKSDLGIGFYHSSYDVGHTFKPYFMYWNGEGFTEYGGLQITEEQLRSVPGASKYLDDIKARGGDIGAIYYRENGIVNINYSIYRDDYPSILDYEYVILRIVDGVAEEYEGTSKGYYGIYLPNVLENVSFPDESPYGESAEPEPTHAWGEPSDDYTLADEAYADIDGDGVQERLALYIAPDEYGASYMSLRIFEDQDELKVAYPLQAFSTGAEYLVRVHLMPDGMGQRIYVESLHMDGDAFSKRYAMLTYDGDGLSGEISVFDPGYTDCVYLSIVSEPGGEEAELLYHEADSYSYMKDYMEALNTAFADWNMYFAISLAGDGDMFYMALLDSDALLYWKQGSALSFGEDGQVDREEGYEPVPQVTPSVDSTDYGYVLTLNNIRMRSEPGEDAAVICKIPKGTLVSYAGYGEYDSHGAYWLKVYYEGSTGWLLSTYVRHTDELDYYPNYPDYDYDDDYYDYYDDYDYDYYDDYGDYYDSYLLHTTGKVYLRSEPDKESKILCTVPNNTTIKYMGDYSYDNRGVCWYKAQYDGKTGWISSVYAELEGMSNQYVSIEGNSTNLRSGPGLSYKVVKVLHKGDRVLFLGDTDMDSRGVMWYNVLYDGESCWVSSKYADLD